MRLTSRLTSLLRQLSANESSLPTLAMDIISGVTLKKRQGTKMHIDQLPPEILPGRWLEHTQRVLRQIPDARYYAPNHGALRALSATVAVWAHGRNEGFNDASAATFLAEILPLILGAMQDWRPGPKPEELDWSIFRDPITGHIINPWAKNNKDVNEQMFIAREYPRHAEYLKATKDGVKASYLHKQREEKKEREYLRKVAYTHEQHRQNVFVNGTITQQMEFAKANPRAVIDAHKWEAQTQWRIPWHPRPDGSKQNLTQWMALKKKLGALADDAVQLERQWAQKDLESVRGSWEQTREMRESAEQLLGAK